MTETRARSTQPSSDSKRRILIVDDEPSIVRMLAEMLQQDGYICSGCQSGKEAMHLINTQQFDVILMRCSHAWNERPGALATRSGEAPPPGLCHGHRRGRHPGGRPGNERGGG